MKKILIIFIIFSFSCAGQNTDIEGICKSHKSRKNFLYINPFSFINNNFQINYERLISKRTGVLITGGYTLIDCYDDGKEGINSEIHFRIYFSDALIKNKKKFYISPYFKFQYMESNLGYYKWDNINNIYYYHDEPDIYVSSYSGGILCGLKWILKTNFTIDLFAGGGMHFSHYNGEISNPSMDFGYSYYGYYNGFLPKIGFQLGYNF